MVKLNQLFCRNQCLYPKVVLVGDVLYVLFFSESPVFNYALYFMGPFFSNQKVEYNYAPVLCDSNTRYPFAYPLRSLSAKNVCNALLQVFQMTGIPSTIRSDCGSNFTSQLTTTFLKYLGCRPNFNVPGRPQ